MGKLFLADLSKMTEDAIKVHLATEYAEEDSKPWDEPNKEYLDNLRKYDILVAYESVGAYGCDSSSWFLLKNKEDGKLYEINGSHCSCYGFEGQGELNEVPLDALKYRSDYSILSTGGYDDDDEKHRELVREYIQNL